ncbi:MAG TPA: cAMP-activated global transcriptional regulator CRP [Gammaproteobacteria bacterium]|nr:cAMP-activated global transcriptional regulator CRP [Gammaproteobacteria bacterium]
MASDHDSRRKSFGNPAIDRFLAHCHIRTFPSKTVIIHAGDVPDTLYFVVEGSVAVVIEDSEGNEIVLAYLNRGEFFGEMGMFQEHPQRSAWVRTRVESRIAEIHYARFKQLAHEDPDLLFALAAQLAARLVRTTRKVGDLAFLDVTGRVARTLLDLCREPDAMTHPDGMQIRVSRQEIGRIVGCSREMAGRVLKSLEEQGLISVSGKTIVVIGARPGAERAKLATQIGYK